MGEIRTAMLAVAIFIVGVMGAGCEHFGSAPSPEGLIAGKKWGEISAGELDEMLAKGEFDPNRPILSADRNGERGQVAPLMSAVVNNDPEYVRVLIKHGAEVNRPDYPIAISPLHFAVGRGRGELVSLLIDAGADVNLTDKFGNSLLDYAIRGVANGHAAEDNFFRVADMLVAAGSDVNVRNSHGWNLIHEALFYGCVGLIPKLIEIGVDVAGKTPGKMTPLLLAANSNFRAISVLVDGGADVNSDSAGYTPLMMALAGKNPVEAAEILISMGADVNQIINKTIRGQTLEATALLFAGNIGGRKGHEHGEGYRSLWEVEMLRRERFPACANDDSGMPTVEERRVLGQKAEALLLEKGAVNRDNSRLALEFSAHFDSAIELLQSNLERIQ